MEHYILIVIGIFMAEICENAKYNYYYQVLQTCIESIMLHTYVL